MNNVTKLSLTVLAALIITACSSGDSSSSGNSTSSVTSLNMGQPVAGVTNNVVDDTSLPVSGAVYQVDGDDNFVTVMRKNLRNNGKVFEQIVVDGQPIPIAYVGISSRNSWEILKLNDDFAVCCGKYSDVRFGLVENPAVDERDYLFYNGNVTQTMPISGTATYRGDFIAIFNDDYYPVLDHRFDDDRIIGNATFNADFANKTLSGQLSNAGISPISVNATISGNAFNGSASSSSFNTKADLEGKFYGKNAKELGGMFFDKEKTWGGAFGAAK